MYIYLTLDNFPADKRNRPRFCYGLLKTAIVDIMQKENKIKEGQQLYCFISAVPWRCLSNVGDSDWNIVYTRSMPSYQCTKITIFVCLGFLI